VSQKADITQLEVIEAGHGQATVALDAVVHTRWRDDRSGRITGQSLAMVGPVTLQRRDGHWHITDYSVEGRPVSLATRIHPAGSQEQHGVRIAARAMHLGGSATSLVLEVGNGGDAELDVLWCVLTGPGRFPGYRRLPFLGAARVPSGGTALVGAAGRVVLPLSTRSIEIACSCGTARLANAFRSCSRSVSRKAS
jgi:hypothetical protein